MSSLRPGITVILPVFNMGDYLADTLKAILTQEALTPGDQILVVDNGSTDRSMEIAQGYQGVRVLHEPKRGSYAARNLGITGAKGDILAFLDPDCRPKQGWLDAVRDSMRDPSIAIVLGSKNFATLNRRLRVLTAYENEKTRWVLSRGNPCHVYGYTNNMAVRRSVFDRFGLFQERVRGSDTILVQQVVHCLGVSVVRFNPQMEVDHLEITSARQHYRKQAIYGYSNECLVRDVPFRPLSNRQRLAVVFSLARRRILNPWQLGLLFLLLVPGAVLYEWGRRGAK
jgi:glycosyltransferase involved in cell wall biosynthesis